MQVELAKMFLEDKRRLVSVGRTCYNPSERSDDHRLFPAS